MPVASFAPGILPGTDPLAWVGALEDELPAPHSPAVPELPARGHPAGLTGRATALLSELHTDLTSYGWRLTSGAGADHRRAASLLRADVDVLTDVRGERAESGTASATAPLTLFVLGPVSLCARLALPDGEKVLIDHGARRDVTDSLAAGIAELTARLQRTALAAPADASSAPMLRVVLLEPDYHRVRAGQIPTVSGYQSIGALPRDEARALVGRVLEQLRVQAAAAETESTDELLVDLGRAPEPEHVEDLFARSQTRADGFVLPVTGMDAHQWERVAELVEAGARCGAAVLSSTELAAAAGPSSTDALPAVSTLAQRVRGPWQGMGMPPASLEAFALTTAGAQAAGPGHLLRDAMARLSPAAALRAMTRVRDAAEALEDQRRQG